MTNWLNYDTIYTERYMGLPSENPDGYAATALPAHAGNLKGKLLLVHNREDDNVLFQNTLQLANALEEEDKQFEMMVYPKSRHGVLDPDLVKQMHQLMLDFVMRNLKP